MEIKINGEEDHSLLGIDFEIMARGSLIFVISGEYTKNRNMAVSFFLSLLFKKLIPYVTAVNEFNHKTNKNFPSFLFSLAETNFHLSRLIMCKDPIFHCYSSKIRHHQKALSILTSPTNIKAAVVLVVEKETDIPPPLKDVATLVVKLN